MEIPADKLISRICKLLQVTNSEDIDIDSSNEQRVELVIKTKFDLYPFNWHFHLEKQTPHQVRFLNVMLLLYIYNIS